MDVDNGGSVSMRELSRVLLGEMVHTFEVEFIHPDTGVVWGRDIEGFIAIANIEEHSPASIVPSLIPGFSSYAARVRSSMRLRVY